MCWVVWEKGCGEHVVFCSLNVDKLHAQDHPTILGSKVLVVVSGVLSMSVLLGKIEWLCLYAAREKLQEDILKFQCPRSSKDFGFQTINASIPGDPHRIPMT